MEPLYHIIEDFISNEINPQLYDQSELITERSKRRLRRNLNKELADYFNQQNQLDDIKSDSDTKSDTDTKSDNESSDESPYKKCKYENIGNSELIIPQRNVDICLGATLVCILFTFYGSIIYLVQAYSDHLNFQPSKTC